MDDVIKSLSAKIKSLEKQSLVLEEQKNKLVALLEVQKLCGLLGWFLILNAGGEDTKTTSMRPEVQIQQTKVTRFSRQVIIGN